MAGRSHWSLQTPPPWGLRTPPAHTPERKIRVDGTIDAAPVWPKISQLGLTASAQAPCGATWSLPCPRASSALPRHLVSLTTPGSGPPKSSARHECAAAIEDQRPQRGEPACIAAQPPAPGTGPMAQTPPSAWVHARRERPMAWMASLRTGLVDRCARCPSSRDPAPMWTALRRTQPPRRHGWLGFGH